MQPILVARGRTLSLDQPRVMGVLNVTPDSFSDGGKLFAGKCAPDRTACLARARDMLAQGAAIIDVGGESTRPGANPVSAEEECERVIPVVEDLVNLDTMVSVDTNKTLVAQAALSAGAHLINDVRAGADLGLVDVVAESGAAMCLMHMQGEPRTMQEQPVYRDLIAEVRSFLISRVRVCRAAGMLKEHIVIDPGFGFGKTLSHNLELLRCLSDLRDQHAASEAEELADLALAIGISRKSMIGALTEREVGERDGASAVAAALCVERGANIVRAHNVAATVDALRVTHAVMAAPEEAL